MPRPFQPQPFHRTKEKPMNSAIAKSQCSLTRHRSMPINRQQMHDTNIIPFKRINPKERVAFYSRGMTMEAVMKDHWAFGIRCRQRRYRQGAVYLDFDWIPTKLRRPQLVAMLTDAYDHKFDVLAVPSPDRISRDPNELIRIISELQTHGIRIALMNDALKSPKRLASKPNRKASA